MQYQSCRFGFLLLCLVGFVCLARAGSWRHPRGSHPSRSSWAVSAVSPTLSISPSPPAQTSIRDSAASSIVRSDIPRSFHGCSGLDARMSSARVARAIVRRDTIKHGIRFGLAITIVPHPRRSQSAMTAVPNPHEFSEPPRPTTGRTETMHPRPRNPKDAPLRL